MYYDRSLYIIAYVCISLYMFGCVYDLVYHVLLYILYILMRKGSNSGSTSITSTSCDAKAAIGLSEGKYMNNIDYILRVQ